MNGPFIPFYTSDFLAGTGGMTAATKGVYITLLCLIYEAEGPIPQPWETLARRCGCTLPAFKKAVQALSDEGKITVTDAGIWSDKCEKHLALRRERRNGASASAKARWQKEQQKQGKADANAMRTQCERNANQNQNQSILEDTSVSSLSSADDAKPFDEIAEAVSAYNVAAEESGWPKVAVLSKARRAALAARMREAGGIAGWQAALAKAQASDMCCGQNQRGWVANFDFLTRQSSFAKLMEGNYDNRNPKHSANHAGGSGPHSGMVAAFAEVAARKSGRT